MFNTSFKLREQTGFISPKGPSFYWAPRYTTQFSSARVSLKIPRHRHPSAHEPITPPRYYDLDKRYDMGGDSTSPFPVVIKKLIDLLYTFYGNAFTGRKGLIEFRCWLVKPMNMPPEFNLFHPRALENFIVNRLERRHGKDFSSDGIRQAWNGPINWQPQTHLPCPAVRYEMQANPAFRAHQFSSYFVFPIHRYFAIELCCTVTRNHVPDNIKPEPGIDEWIDVKPFRALIDQIYNSVQVDLSAEALAHMQEASAHTPDMALIKHFEPLIFTPPKKAV